MVSGRSGRTHRGTPFRAPFIRHLRVPDPYDGEENRGSPVVPVISLVSLPTTDPPLICPPSPKDGGGRDPSSTGLVDRTTSRLPYRLHTGVHSSCLAFTPSIVLSSTHCRLSPVYSHFGSRSRVRGVWCLDALSVPVLFLSLSVYMGVEVSFGFFSCGTPLGTPIRSGVFPTGWTSGTRDGTGPRLTRKRKTPTTGVETRPCP